MLKLNDVVNTVGQLYFSLHTSQSDICMLGKNDSFLSMPDMSETKICNLHPERTGHYLCGGVGGIFFVLA